VAVLVHLAVLLLAVSDRPGWAALQVLAVRLPEQVGSAARLPEWVARLPEWVARLLEWVARLLEWVARLLEWVARLLAWVARLLAWVAHRPDRVASAVLPVVHRPVVREVSVARLLAWVARLLAWVARLRVAPPLEVLVASAVRSAHQAVALVPAASAGPRLAWAAPPPADLVLRARAPLVDRWVSRAPVV
jgi:hypothetical protein